MSLADDLLTIIGDADTQETDVKGWLSTGYEPLNKLISGKYDGGFGYGLMYEVYGPSGSGKTVIASNAIIEAQKAGGLGILIDFERSFKPSMGEALGMKTNKPHLLHLYPKTWEEGMTKGMQLAEMIRTEKVIPEDAPIVMVTDSIAAAVPKSVMEKELTEHNMNDTTALARATSMTLKVVAARSMDIGLTSIFLNQIRLKPGVVYGDPTTTPGGGAMEFYATARLAIGRKLEKKDKQVVSQTINFKTTKNRHTRPFQESSLMVKWTDEGAIYFDIDGSMLDYLIDQGKLEMKGARVTWTDGKTYFKSKLLEHIQENDLQSELKALLLNTKSA